jgi:hypothetical protein
VFGALAAVIGVALLPVLVKAQTRKTPEQEAKLAQGSAV